MTPEEIKNLPGRDNPVLCADGKMALLLIYPRDDGQCGLQVPGEKAHRWAPAADLTAGPGGALRQSGAPVLPSVEGQTNMAHTLLAFDWADRGGAFDHTEERQDDET